MSKFVILLSVPALRALDLTLMPRLSGLIRHGDQAELVPSFPAVTCPVQANMTTGLPPKEHGVVANGFYWRDKGVVEMWTSANDCIGSPQIWDLLHHHNRSLTSAVWFPLHSKECGADYVCTPAPIHHPDGSESLWCYTRPKSLYGDLIEELGHFPLHKFWGPMSSIDSTAWIIDSAIRGAERFRPNFFTIYLPHLDYATQKEGPDSDAARTALTALDVEIGKLIDGLHNAYADDKPLWLVASEYAITPVDHVLYPNRQLRDAGLLSVIESDEGELIDYQASKAWAMVDHQFSHIFIRAAEPDIIRRAAALFHGEIGVTEVLSKQQQQQYNLDHDRSGELVVISEPNSWQAYYWWLDERQAPSFARTVDIHRKPGYDPVEMFIEPSPDSPEKGTAKGPGVGPTYAMSTPLDATLVCGSHGAPARDSSQRGILLASQQGLFNERSLADTDVADIVLRHFGYST